MQTMERVMIPSFSDEEVAMILDRHEDGESISQLAYFLEVDYQVIYNIISGKTYKDVTSGVSRPVKSEVDTEKLVGLIEDGFPTTYVAKECGVTPSHVSRLYSRTTGRSVREFRKGKSVRYNA